MASPSSDREVALKKVREDLLKLADDRKNNYEKFLQTLYGSEYGNSEEDLRRIIEGDAITLQNLFSAVVEHENLDVLHLICGQCKSQNSASVLLSVAADFEDTDMITEVLKEYPAIFPPAPAEAHDNKENTEEDKSENEETSDVTTCSTQQDMSMPACVSPGSPATTATFESVVDDNNKMNIIDTTDARATLTLSEMYEQYNYLDFDQNLSKNEFWSFTRGDGSWKDTISEYASEPRPNPDRKYEVIYVNYKQDWKLQKIVTGAKKIFKESTDFVSLLMNLTDYVHDKMGGDNSSNIIQFATERSKQYRHYIDNLMKVNSSCVVHLGDIQFGVCKHRAMLFKVICDKWYNTEYGCKFRVMSRLVRGHYSDQKCSQPHAWNTVYNPEDGRYYVVDCMMPHNSRVFAADDALSSRYSFDRTKGSVGGSSIRNMSSLDLNTLKTIPNHPTISTRSDNNVEIEFVSSSSGQQEYAKKILSMDNKLRQHSLRELEIMTFLNHEYLLSPQYIQVTKDSAIVITKRMTMSCDKFLNEERSFDPSKRQVIQILRKVAIAVEYMHKVGIIHYDIKPANILLNVQDGDIESVKLIDFGAARLKSETMMNVRHELTHRYAPPEAKQPGNQATFSKEFDCFSFGVTLGELCTKKKSKGALTSEDFPEEFKDLVALYKECTCSNRICRPPFTSIVAKLEELE